MFAGYFFDLAGSEVYSVALHLLSLQAPKCRVLQDICSAGGVSSFEWYLSNENALKYQILLCWKALKYLGLHRKFKLADSKVPSFPLYFFSSQALHYKVLHCAFALAY